MALEPCAPKFQPNVLYTNRAAYDVLNPGSTYVRNVPLRNVGLSVSKDPDHDSGSSSIPEIPAPSRSQTMLWGSPGLGKLVRLINCTSILDTVRCRAGSRPSGQRDEAKVVTATNRWVFKGLESDSRWRRKEFIRG